MFLRRLGAEMLGYVGKKKAESLNVEFCDFVHCRMKKNI
jgi:hypothetical protein